MTNVNHLATLGPIELALRTKSDQFHGDKVPMYDMAHWLDEAIGALQQLDRIKKALMYGRDYPARKALDHNPPATCELLPFAWNGLSTSQAIDVIHGILGKATEGGELLELLRDAMANPGGFNRVAAIEETFDSRWYDYACMLPALGITAEECETMGFAKLRERYPDKFTVQRANERDLKAEAVAMTGDANAAPLHSESGSGFNSGDLIAAMHRDGAGS